MSEKRPQTLANHAKTDPMFHFVIGPLSFICCGWAIYFAVHRTIGAHIWYVVLSLTIVLLVFKCRLYALKVQDRVIRLEERLRLSALLPEPLRTRIPELTEAQLIALRFASDEEIPSLVDKTLRENLDTKAVKQAINNWRPDYWRV
jgi:Family of unknown function (DUF6526)